MSRDNVQSGQSFDFSAQYKLLYESLRKGGSHSPVFGLESLWNDPAADPKYVRLADAICALTLLEQPALLAQLKTHLPANTIKVKPEDFVNASLDDLQHQFDSLTALVNHLGETARAEESFAMALLDYPELLRQLDYWLGEIARAHPSFVEALLRRLDVLRVLFRYQRAIIFVEAEPRFLLQAFENSGELGRVAFRGINGEHFKGIIARQVEFALALLNDPQILSATYGDELSEFFAGHPGLVEFLLGRPDLQGGFSSAQHLVLARIDPRLAMAVLDYPEWLMEYGERDWLKEHAEKFPEFARKVLKILRDSGSDQIMLKPIVQDHLVKMGLTWLPAVLDAVGKVCDEAQTTESRDSIEKALCMALAYFPIPSDEGDPRPGMADFLNYCPEGGISIAAAIRAAEQERGMTPGGKGSFFAQNAEGGPPVPGITFST